MAEMLTQMDEAATTQLEGVGQMISQSASFLEGALPLPGAAAAAAAATAAGVAAAAAAAAAAPCLAL
jgi:hypothetical protein